MQKNEFSLGVLLTEVRSPVTACSALGTLTRIPRTWRASGVGAPACATRDMGDPAETCLPPHGDGLQPVMRTAEHTLRKRPHQDPDI